ncbi:MAG: hypothetical protein K0S47_2488 [Herbinix sp.]|jgi:hypothetical protein|nr:hypothetical protein [Herbinix sp.]
MLFHVYQRFVIGTNRVGYYNTILHGKAVIMFMMVRMKKICIISIFLILSVVLVVFCVNYFSQTPVNEYDGTLVQAVDDSDCL